MELNRVSTHHNPVPINSNLPKNPVSSDTKKLADCAEPMCRKLNIEKKVVGTNAMAPPHNID